MPLPRMKAHILSDNEQIQDLCKIGGTKIAGASLWSGHCLMICLLVVTCSWLEAGSLRLTAAEPATQPAAVTESNSIPDYNISAITVSSSVQLSTNVLKRLFSKYAGGHVTLDQLVQAAADLQAEYRKEGYPMMSVMFSKEETTNGVVTFNVVATAVPQIVVSGVRYRGPTNVAETASSVLSPPSETVTNAPPPPAASTVTTRHPPPQPIPVRSTPDTPEQIAEARKALAEKMAEFSAWGKDTRIHVVSTNAGPRFAVKKYLVTGNTVLSPQTMSQVLTNIDGDYGTNVSFDGVRTAVEQLQKAYRDRGYVTVAVGLPPQKLTNQTVKVKVTEGPLAAINITGNRHFSSANIMRALPSLHTNMLLNGPIFQAELNRANGNQDRQIYPVIGPGPDPGTSALTLKVKDRLPLHAKEEFNNQNSPGTPDFRFNTSAVYQNLWQEEQSLGVQYGFSPQVYKEGSQWNFYDQPAVAYYSAFYRLPLGNLQPIEDQVANSSGSFGYNEATHQFRLPPPSGRTELNLYGSRATIDTGLEMLLNSTLFNIPDVRTVTRQEVQQGITINQDLGFQLSQPLPQVAGINSTLSGGLDFKTYSQVNSQTNIFTFIEFTKGPNQNLIERVSHDYIATPLTDEELSYLPLEIGCHANLHDPLGQANAGLGLSVNLWYSSQTSFTSSDTNGNPAIAYKHGKDSLQNITGSTESSGHWVVLRPSFSQQFELHTNWPATFRANGQWASEPLISNEQFGIGGVNSVRGYHEGEVFGDTGWYVSFEQQTPSLVVGMIHGDQPLILRGSAYMDYGRIYLLDPQGRADHTALWGTGFGIAASVGSYWQARLLFSLPLIGTAMTPCAQPYFNFALTSQF